MAAWIWVFCAAVVIGDWLGPAGPACSPAWALLPLAGLATAPEARLRRCLLAGLCGYLFAMLALGSGLSHWLPAAASGEARVLAGRVQGLPELRRDERGPRQRFVLSVTRPDQGPRRLSLTWYRPDRPLRPGERIRLRARLFRPRARVNEAGFDRARQDLAAGMDGHGYVRAILWRDHRSRGIDAFRARLSARVRRAFRHWPTAARWLPALVTGDRRHLSDADWRLLRRSGTVHLMAISGLHITLVAGWVWWLFRFLPLSLWPPLRRYPAQQLAVFPALAAALGYALLAGLGLPTQRALIMATLVFLSLLRGRRRSLAWHLAVAMAGVLLWHPLAPLSWGFWLSFGAVALLSLVLRGGWRGVLRAQWLLGLGLGALTGWLFGDWGLLAPLANLVLIPLFSLVLVPLALLAALSGLPAVLAGLLGPLTEGIRLALAQLVPLAPALPPPQGLGAVICVVLALALLLSPATLLPRRFAPFLLLPVFFAGVDAPAHGDFRVVVFDVGQGQAVAVRTRHAIVLYDLGPAWPGGDSGHSLIAPWLARRHVEPVLAFASHGDSDHAGGLAGVAPLLPPGRLFSGEPERLSGAHACLRGQRWWLDGVRFEVLWPAPGVETANSNNRSCVLRVSGAHGRLLLTGDIEKPVEYWLARHGPLDAELLQVPHHGSASSSSFTLLNAVRPNRAFASAGHLNPFGHPAASVRKRYRRRGVPLEITAETGMIVFPLDGQHNAAPQRWRAKRYRPWRAVIE